MLNDVLWRPVIFPFNISGTPATGVFNMCSADYFIAYSVLNRAAKVLSKLRFYDSGTGVVSSVTVELQADDGAGAPSGTALDSATITSLDNTIAWREAKLPAL